VNASDPSENRAVNMPADEELRQLLHSLPDVAERTAATATLPTTAQVHALHKFIQERNEDEWKGALADYNLSDTWVESVRRLSNSTRLAVAGTTAYLIACLVQEQHAQAAHAWDYLTGCGEQWQEHPDWKAEWANPARAALR